MVRKTSPWRETVTALTAGALLMTVAACSTNPATGKRQIALVSEQQEIAMGLEADKQIEAQMGLYPDEQLQSYVAGLGRKLAADSERPELPWTFKVVDDQVVNAFALPGGHIYVTRGLLSHLTSEAELVSVLGHEIGHVTARHSVEQMSKAQLAQIGLLAGMILSPQAAQYGDLASSGLQLLFLKYSRDDERQADDLGLRYLVRESYDPRQMPEVFETLRRVSEREAQAGGGRVPNWMSTHPAPEDRVQRISAQVAKMDQDFSNARVNREGYLRNIDNIVFGDNPREGYFRGNLFVQPELGFQVRFPQGWKATNQKSAVGAISPREDAMVVVSLSGQSSPQAAAQAFFSQQGIQQGQALNNGSGGGSGTQAVTQTFGVQRGQGGDLRGVASFVEHQGKVYQLLGYTTESNWGAYDDELAQALGTFERVTDPQLLNVTPKRVDVVSLPSAMTLEEFARRYPSTVDLETLGIINQANAGTRFDAGADVKRVVGGDLPS
jgi:predicted Zn-dependent protease